MYQTIDPYQELANAIIVSASRDYMKVYKKYLRTGLGYERVMYEERFFFSDLSVCLLQSVDELVARQGLHIVCGGGEVCVVRECGTACELFADECSVG